MTSHRVDEQLQTAERLARASVAELRSSFRRATPLSELLTRVDRVFARLEEGNVHLALALDASHEPHAMAHAELARALSEEALALAATERAPTPQ